MPSDVPSRLNDKSRITPRKDGCSDIDRGGEDQTASREKASSGRKVANLSGVLMAWAWLVSLSSIGQGLGVGRYCSREKFVATLVDIDTEHDGCAGCTEARNDCFGGDQR